MGSEDGGVMSVGIKGRGSSIGCRGKYSTLVTRHSSFNEAALSGRLYSSSARQISSLKGDKGGLRDG